MKKISLVINLVLITIFALPTNAGAYSKSQPSARQLYNGGDVIAAINGYRQQYGLASVSTNSLLTSLAQSQSDYQASIGSITHTGPGGSTPQQRAAAAGYGGGKFFYLSEIIYGGYNQTVLDALAWWQNSSLHNSIILNSKYTEIGAGVATDGDSIYFTAVLGGPTGGSASSTEGSPPESPGTGESSQPTTSGPIIMPIQKATPQADGSIIHTVLSGQTLWTIAAVYKLDLQKLLDMNVLTQWSYVFPGDQIIVRESGQYENDAVTPTPLDGKAETPISTGESSSQLLGLPYSSINDNSLLPTSTLVATNLPPSSTITPESENLGILSRNPLVRNLVLGALIILILVMGWSLWIQKPTPNPKDENQT